ncbi:nitrite/sulfite reductase [Streptomyces sp. NPDC018057]|uniref:nitrite/sulfite reductase n=1 Tax=unclassified Streptomyces TaxID=2593676 RepID=UPI0037B01121
MAAAASQNSVAPRRKVSRHRGEGQWAAGHLTPLNGNEQLKKDDDGLNVRTRIETIYSKRGFHAIDPNDLRGRFRWWGLYTQRRPGIDGGRTGLLEPEELEDEYFMMRVRITGGRLTTEQLRAIGEVAETYARGTADITDRQNIQFHWVRIEDVPAIWERLEAVGLSTTEACGDCPRGMLGSPVAGVAEDEIIDGTAALDEIVRRYIGDPRFSNLPRKFKTAVSGSPLLDVAHEINDISFVGVVHPEHGPGFDLWVGGGLSTNPRFGVRLGAWVPEAEVPDVWEGVTSIFRDYGYRRLRNRARLKFLIADWGAEKFRQVLEDEYLGRKLTDGPAPEMPARQWRDHIGVHRQKDGRFYVGFAPRVGRMDGSLLTKVAALAEEHGSGRVSTTVEQKMIVLDVPGDRVDSLVDGLEALDLRVSPSPFRRGTMACTGIEFCKLAIVETKERGSDLIDELERRLPDFDEPVTINLNGCPNACARIQTADIGLKGQLVTDAEGNQVGGYQVHLGGALGLEPSFGRKVRGLKVTSAELPDYIERVLKRFQAERADGERFAAWAARASEEALS